MNGGTPAQPGGTSGDETVPSTQQSTTDSQERMWAMWCHLAAFSTFIVPIGSVLGPLVVWLSKRQEYPLVDREGKKALNFQITVFILFVVFFIVFFAVAVAEAGAIAVIVALIGLAMGISWLVLVIMAAVRTNEGKDYRYPLSITFLK